MLDFNTTGTFLTARAVAKEMRAAKVTGSIVLIASMSGHVSNKGINMSVYCASKAAVHQLERSLAAEGAMLRIHSWAAPRRRHTPIRPLKLAP
jgi:NAD(P)-dependent dehydrogenase (short-subunit alcohol dehydrogenase family)